jgi:hypothetical protein
MLENMARRQSMHHQALTEKDTAMAAEAKRLRDELMKQKDFAEEKLRSMEAELRQRFEVA